MTTTTQGSVRSHDGTTLAYERTGSGPSLILVEAAAHYRAFSSFTCLVGLLAADFTVYDYDRRGRGDSGDTLPYAVEREVQDLAALVAEAGGSAYVYGYSSGGLLAMRAAASGLAIPRMVLLEPPIEAGEERAAQAAFTAELADLVAAGRRVDAVDRLMTGVGVPTEMIAEMRGTPAWSAMAAVAHTFVYDCLISEATSARTLASVTVPTLVLDSAGSTDDLAGMAAAVAGMLPHGSHRSLPGEWHGVADDVLAPVLTEFLLL